MRLLVAFLTTLTCAATFVAVPLRNQCHANDLEDFLDQMRSFRKMGPLTQMMEMIPGMNKFAGKLNEDESEAQLKKVEALILSMTPQERQKPSIIGGSRRKRIARGSGLQPQDVNRLLNQFQQIQKLMQMGARGKLPKNMMNMFR